MDPARIRRSESPFTAARGDVLFRRAWRGPDPQYSLLLVHGFGEHSGRYEHFGAWFAERGCAVHAFDLFGHGRSDGPRGHVRKFSDFLDDLDEMLRFVREQEPGRPIVLVGHSMGGLIATMFASERAPEVAGVVTSGAALSLTSDVSPLKVALANALAPVLPRVRLDAGVDPAGLSHSADVVERYCDDPLVLSKITLSLAKSLFGASRRSVPGGSRIRVPMLLLHGEDDPICPAAGSRALFEQLEDGRAKLATYPGMLHEIFNEPGYEPIFEDLLEWVRSLPG